MSGTLTAEADILSNKEKVFFLHTHTHTDMYRAGLIVARGAFFFLQILQS